MTSLCKYLKSLKNSLGATCAQKLKGIWATQ